ncbi:MAG: hypothetical protein RL518_1440 [Pseudomonadota bacterium]|jgi:UPF0755 protein
MRKFAIIALYLLLPLAAAVASYRAVEHYFFAPLDPTSTTTSIFEVSPDKTFREIAADLEVKNYIKHRYAIRVLAKYQKKDTAVMAGEYEFSPSMTPQQILDAMIEGKMILRKITLKEGVTLSEIGPILEEAGITQRALFEQALNDPSLREELQVPASSFEGYLFPETYRIQRNTPPRKVIQTLRNQLDTTWSPEWDARLQELQMSKHQILTLASIIEKESGNAEEQPLVSSVFHNRLKIGMRLQSDPTVIYGIPNFNGNLTKVDLQTPSPYNTYVISGLPPGPIANPGLTAIKAALYPAQTTYFYFVGNGKGKHIFSEHLEQHNQAVNVFQRGIGASAFADAEPTTPTPQEPVPAGPQT